MGEKTSHPEQLDALVGAWSTEAIVQGQSMGRVHTTFSWLGDGAFLLQRAEADLADRSLSSQWAANSPLPTQMVIGLDDATGRFSALYADARNVKRVYEMSLHERVWKMWRAAPGFHQRFTGTFSRDGETITAKWDSSEDGSDWKPDFDLVYIKLK
jgi:hypothetical protein